MVCRAGVVPLPIGHAERNAVRCDRAGHGDRHERGLLAHGKAAGGLVIERLDLMHGHIGLGAEHLAVHLAGQIAVGKPVARKDLAQDVILFLGRAALVAQQSGVNLGDNRAVLRALHPALDFER